MKRTLGIALLSVGLSACGGDDSLEVSASDFGKEWPLTVSSGVLKCKKDNGIPLAIIEVDGTEYQLNGAASSRGYAPINPIWKANPEIAGTKINIGPLIDKSLSLCAG